MDKSEIVKQITALLEKRLEEKLGPDADLCSADGIASMEQEILDIGRELLQESFGQALQAKAHAADQHPHDCPKCGETLHRQGKKKDHAERGG